MIITPAGRNKPKHLEQLPQRQYQGIADMSLLCTHSQWRQHKSFGLRLRGSKRDSVVQLQIPK